MSLWKHIARDQETYFEVEPKQRGKVNFHPRVVWTSHVSCLSALTHRNAIASQPTREFWGHKIKTMGSLAAQLLPRLPSKGRKQQLCFPATVSQTGWGRQTDS
jgi:hypothetical protein